MEVYYQIFDLLFVEGKSAIAPGLIAKIDRLLLLEKFPATLLDKIEWVGKDPLHEVLPVHVLWSVRE